MTTTLTYRCNVLMPTECVMDDTGQWTLVYGNPAILSLLDWKTTHRRMWLRPGGWSLHVQIQQDFAAENLGGEFIPAWKPPEVDPNFDINNIDWSKVPIH